MKRVPPQLTRDALLLILAVTVVFFVVMTLPSGVHHVILAIAGVLIAAGLRPMIVYREQSGWKRVNGIVVEVEEREVSVFDGDSGLYHKYYYPHIEFEYGVDGRCFVGCGVSRERADVWEPEDDWGGWPRSRECRWWLTLKVGDEIPVFVDPRDPAKALLVVKASKVRRSHFRALVLAGLLVGGVWGWMAFEILPSEEAFSLRR